MTKINECNISERCERHLILVFLSIDTPPLDRDVMLA
jgi:hypothetical protein